MPCFRSTGKIQKYSNLYTIVSLESKLSVLTITGIITMALHHNGLSVRLTGTRVPQDTAGSRRKQETHAGRGKEVCACVSAFLFVHEKQTERGSDCVHNGEREMKCSAAVFD